jgi:uncharacterized protein DUF6441
VKLIFAAAAGQFPEAFARVRKTVATAATGAIRDAADQVKRQARANIGAAGFSKKWQNAFRVNVYPVKGVSIDAAAFAFHNIKYAGIFERGGTIAGSPLLWLPLPSAPLKVGGRRITPSLYIEQIGPLFKIIRPGKPPLLAALVPGAPKGGRRATVGQLKAGTRNARRRQAQAAFGGRARASAVSLPMFVGVPRVKIRRRFGLEAIFAKARAGLGQGYLRNLSREAR